MLLVVSGWLAHRHATYFDCATAKLLRRSNIGDSNREIGLNALYHITNLCEIVRANGIALLVRVGEKSKAAREKAFGSSSLLANLHEWKTIAASALLAGNIDSTSALVSLQRYADALSVRCSQPYTYPGKHKGIVVLIYESFAVS